MRKTSFFYVKTKAQSNFTANKDQCVCFTDNTIPLLSKFQASSLYLRLYKPISVGRGQKS